MTWIFILWRESQATSFFEVADRCFEYLAVPPTLSAVDNMDIHGEPVVMGAFAWRRGAGTTCEEFLVENRLLLERAEATAIVKLDGDTSVDTARLSLNNHRTKGVVERGETTDHR